ncbi:hypothetical protein DFA_02973 [Cavenderia fasciculata]|uniref:Transmembrane protein n=1 Tax=Cavenderia fasciculata TaxID=261658 RepID=F4PG95_CACFS|nr:uncharacterized protein DFA_02973 [Cavenderia fasciculata]EGG24729.1 hypothetical protein DFA_02973 [Cavenderia fasciculata]|eukprot:XP_004362580.1 hypothetical protein DFA_02973 [Cavenderia fasciculata]
MNCNYYYKLLKYSIHYLFTSSSSDANIKRGESQKMKVKIINPNFIDMKYSVLVFRVGVVSLMYRCFSEKFPPYLCNALSEQEYATIINSYNQTLTLRLEFGRFISMLAIMVVSAIVLFISLDNSYIAYASAGVFIFSSFYMLAYILILNAKYPLASPQYSVMNNNNNNNYNQQHD